MVARSGRAAAMFCHIGFLYLRWYVWRRVRGRDAAAALLERTHQRCAVIAREHFIAFEGVYIKVGQVISMMVGFLPDAYLNELEGLQDSVPAQPFEAIRRRVETEFGRPIGEAYSEFAREPVASASLGQVHMADLADGTPVAVKVQYPGIERIVTTDLFMLRVVMHVIGWIVPGFDAERIWHDISETIRMELVYRNEGRNAERIAAKFTDNPRVDFPAIIWDHTTDKVLTMQRMSGMKISDVDAITAAGIVPRDVIEILVNAYFKQLLVDGLYHADPHAGNFFVNPVDEDGVVKPRITFLDFGAVAEFPDEFRQGMKQVVHGYMIQDNSQIIAGMRTMGFEAAGGDERVFETAVRYYVDKLLHLNVEDFTQIDLTEFDLWTNLEDMQLSFRELARAFEVPRNWFYVERTLALLLGLCARLDPSVDAFLYGFPYAAQVVFDADPKLVSLWSGFAAPQAKTDPEDVAIDIPAAVADTAAAESESG